MPAARSHGSVGPRSAIARRILVVYGTRPEAIKMAPVVAALRRRPSAFAVTVCSTGQHRDLLRQAHAFLDIAPDVDLDLMRPDGSLSAFAAAALVGVDTVIARCRPDWLLMQGDTTTAMAAALAAFHRRVPVGHVEAGLRTGDLAAPFPEEANRRIADALASALFAPTERAASALRAEGRAAGSIHVVGNTVIDALRAIADKLPAEPPGRRAEVLVTIHRRESFGAPLHRVLGALRHLARAFPDTDWIYPAHPNPNVREVARQALAGLPNLLLCEPLDYRDLIGRLRRCRFVITDSGGIQEEAPAFGKPTLVLRDVTERPEGVEAGVAQLVGTDPAILVAAANALLSSPSAYDAMARAVNPYGDGRAAERIVSVLADEPWEPFAPAACKRRSPS